MLGKKSTSGINRKKINEIMDITSKILKVVYILLFILFLYILTIVGKEWKILDFIFSFIDILMPLFLGIIIAWLFEPFVRWLCKKNFKRVFAVTIVYVIFIGIIGIILGSIVPMISDQTNDFVQTIPNLLEIIRNWISDLLKPLANIDNFNLKAFEKDLFSKIAIWGTDLMENLPTLTVTLVGTILSGFGTIFVSLIIGFYLLISFDDITDTLFSIIPKKIQVHSKELLEEMNVSLRRFVTGILIDSTLIFIISSICFGVIGLKAPLIFGIFCGITNVIPYAGPYIGGIPAVLVGLSQNPTTGILVFVAIFVLQFIEGNFFQPLIMSKTTKLHPVTIIIGLLIFGHFFGIIGMALSTPIIAVIKTIFLYFENRYHILSIENVEEEE